MLQKWPLFLGIALLINGILLRIFAEVGHWAIVSIILGASFKLYYVIEKIRKGNYKPGYEVFLLYIGLVMFFTGVFLRNHDSSFNHAFLMVPGIALKVAFVVLFMRKTRKANVPFSEKV